LTTCLGTAASAQTAPPAPAPAPTPAAPAPWKITIDFGFSFASGNTNLSIWNTDVSVARLPSAQSEFEWTASLDYGRNRGTLAERRVSSGAKFDYLPQRTISPFTFVNVEQDEVRQIDLQTFGGAGLKFTFWRSDAGKASISGALVYNYETFMTPSLASTPVPSERNARWSVRFKGARRFGTALQVENTTFFQPVLDAPGDYNVSAGTLISSKATSHVALFLRHLYRRDSTPRVGVRQADQRFSGGLRLGF
jgi:hypothetical protein